MSFFFERKPLNEMCQGFKCVKGLGCDFSVPMHQYPHYTTEGGEWRGMEREREGVSGL